MNHLKLIEFAKKDLSVFKLAPLELIAKQIVQYQNYKTSVALKLINKMSYSEASLNSFFTKGRLYLKTGNKNAKCGNLYNYIDNWTEKHIQPLVPKPEEKYDYRPKTNVKNKQEKTVVKEPKKITEKFDYGVKIENKVYIFDTEKECEAFIQGTKLFSNDNVKIVHIKIEEQ